MNLLSIDRQSSRSTFSRDRISATVDCSFCILILAVAGSPMPRSENNGPGSSAGMSFIAT